jgi:hypothetical protein
MRTLAMPGPRSLLLMGLLLPAHAWALGLFGQPGHVDLPPLPRVFAAGEVLAEDDKGALYLNNRSCQATPTSEWLTWSDTPPPGSPFSEVWGPSPLHDGLMGLRFEKRLPDAQHPAVYEHVQILHVRCADLVPLQPIGVATQVLAEGDRSGPPGVVYAADKGIPIGAPDGTVCQWRHEGLWCARPVAGGLEQEVRIDLAKLDAQLGIVPSPAVEMMKQPEGWQALATIWTPEQRLFVLARRQTFHGTPSSAVYVQPRWLLESLPGGKVIARLAPEPPIDAGGHGPIDEVQQMVYLPQLKSLALFPVVQAGDYSHTQVARKGGDGVGNGVSIDLGAAGAGLWLVNLQGPGNGFLSLTDAIARYRSCNTASWGALACESAWAPATIWSRPVTAEFPSGLGILLPSTNYLGQGNVVKQMHTHAVTLQPADLDIDQDGLTAAQEAQHGSSDWLADTDAGGTNDGAEVRLSHSNPAQKGDDPWLAHSPPGRFALVGSQLLPGLRAWAFQDPQLHRVQTWGVAGPLCMAGHCQDADGRVVLDYAESKTYAYAETKAVDGSHLVLQTSAGFERLRWDGVRELAVKASEVEALLPVATSEPGLLRAVPVDLDTLYIVRESNQARVAVFERGKAGRVVFDLQQERCASGLGPCDQHPGGAAKSSLPIHDIVGDQFTVLGFAPDTGRLLLGVSGVWDLYVVGVHPTEPPVLVRRGQALHALPGWLAPTGHGDLMSDGGLLDAYFTIRDTWMGVGVPANNPQLMGAWGDTALRVQGGTVLEMVRYEPGVAPGDVLMLDAVQGGGGGRMLYASKPRGGRAPLWDQPEADMQGVDGMDVSAEHRLCVADRPGRMLWEYSAGPNGIPSQLEVTALVGDIVDCKYDGVGDLHLLFADPPRTEVRHGLAGNSVPEQTLAVTAHPQQFVKKPDGSLEVLDEAEHLRGRIYTRAGRKVEMAQGTLELRVAGVAMSTVKLWWINSQSPSLAERPGRVALAERPDGLLLVGGSDVESAAPYAVIGRFVAVDPRTRRVAEPWPEQHFANNSVGLAVVPGGLAVDPWTQRPVADPAPQGSTDVPVAPKPPLGGSPVPVVADGGCQTSTHGHGGLGLAGLVLVLWVWRRRASVASMAA